eukprot:CAMPEP_0201281332 /NCGR_PEP_ID=MMETSP1317-20130820/2417_1 /ASSEMBLY_ACC=CAM_ASM_000770 /TAXON_ID=187299 /ORGANISM="Undescribed Undescribed, Strain Undescribed" /LENGTH=74 /DNA_ID=CAMNT_0047590917 /DNA_START=311 /DNA_END=535 /DNA_ORIENTATION=-
MTGFSETITIVGLCKTQLETLSMSEAKNPVNGEAEFDDVTFQQPDSCFIHVSGGDLEDSYSNEFQVVYEEDYTP